MNEPHCPVSLYALYLFLLLLLWLRPGDFEFYNVVTLEIRLTPSQGLLSRATVFYFNSDVSKLYLQSLCSLLCVVTEISIVIFEVSL